uniref:Caspase recruitment domain-containing protein 8-like n=1 Tax=Fundulus heteroclitus TaxID=8078 RepID=A0A3Q2PAP8_FUNHE
YPGLFKALVRLFRKPPADPESDHWINVLLLPKNVVLRHVLRLRKELYGDEKFLETPPQCKLQPKRLYTLSTRPGRESVLVQPKEAEFDAESYDNYLPTFQVVYENFMKYIKLSLRDGGSNNVWRRQVCLSTAGVRRSYGPTRQNVGPSEHLKEIRADFIEGISGPVLKSLLDKLLEINVLSDAEREAVEGERTRREKARVLVDMVRNKGDDASSEMIRSLCELDPFFYEHLRLM